MKEHLRVPKTAESGLTLIELVMSLSMGLGILCILNILLGFAVANIDLQERISGWRARAKLASALLRQHVHLAQTVECNDDGGILLQTLQGMREHFFVAGSRTEHFRRGLYFRANEGQKEELVPGVFALQVSGAKNLLRIRLDLETGERQKPVRPWFVDVALSKGLCAGDGDDGHAGTGTARTLCADRG